MHKELAEFKNWLQCQYPNSSASVHYSSDLALFFSFVRKAPANVEPSDVDRYISASLKKGHRPSTINRRLSALRTFYYFLSMTWDQPPACPVLPKHRLRKAYPLPRDVRDLDLRTFFAQINNPRDKAIFLLMLDCGLRVGELHKLSSNDLHFENPSHALVNGKGAKQRIVYISPPAKDALQGWLASRPVSNDRAVFISEQGKRLSVAGIQYLLRGYCKEADVHFTCHQLRHTFGRHMAEADLPLTSLQSLLGHKSVRTTQIYVHLSNSQLQSEYDRSTSRIVTSKPVGTFVNNPKRQRVGKLKGINWDGYLCGLPNWLADLIRDYCSQYLRVNNPIQQTRSRLSQLCGVLRWMLATTSLSFSVKVTPKLWFEYVETRLKSGRKPVSINAALRTLQSFLKYVQNSGHSVCDRMLEVRPLRTGDLLPRDITETQLNQLLNQANLFDYAWILLMAHSGFRTCEIRNLRWKDVDIEHRTVQINESKGLRSRLVFLTVSAQNAVKQLPKTSEYVFSYNNQPLSGRYCQSRLKTLGKKCGTRVTPHQLRHTCATMLLNAGMTIFGVQAILGHRYVDTTLRYARVHDSVVSKDYKRATKTVLANS